MRKTLLFRGSLLVTAVILLNVFLFFPRPIVENPDTSHIVGIRYNPLYGEAPEDQRDALAEIKDFDENAILNYLSQCRERRTLKTAGSYWLGIVEIELFIHTNAGMKHIVIGKDSFTTGGYNTPEYEVLEADEIAEKLLGMMNAKP